MIFTTLISRSSSALLCHLSKSTYNPDAVILFALSANASNLEAILSRLRLLAPRTVGCLSSPLPGTPDTVACSMATFPSKNCIPFRSEIPGRAPVQVGRWSRKGFVDTESPALLHKIPNWGESWDISRDPQSPTELLGQRDINSLIFFSDDAPEGFVRSLSAIPQSNKLGLVASSTPFITGMPFTLFQNEHIYSAGAVGVALKSHPQPTSTTSFHGLIPLSTPMTVSKAQGNLIHELNQSNPAKMLIEAIADTKSQPQSMGKGEEFYLGHFYPESSVGWKLGRVYRILSGGPSRGTIALDAEIAPEENEVVQFFRRVPSSPSTVLDVLRSHIGKKPSIHLCSSHEDVPSRETCANDAEMVQTLPGAFLAASENGFLCTEANSSRLMWKCAVPSAVGSLMWEPSSLTR